jgi:cytochrome c biogenesis protein ResB
MWDRFYKFFTSVRLAVALLALGAILVFWGTIAQVKLGLYQAQHEFFRSFFIYWQPTGSKLRIPIFPGGYLVGGLLLINLFCAHLRYYRPGLKRFGIALIHIGVVLLLLGQLGTDLLAKESFMRIQEGATSNYSESNSHWELAVIDTTDSDDKVVAIPTTLLAKGAEIAHAEMPFKLRVKEFHQNSALSQEAEAGFERVQADNATSAAIWWRGLPLITEMNNRDVPSAIVELAREGERKTFLVSGQFKRAPALAFGGRTYQLAVRPTRYYKPFSLRLIDFRFDRYPGTEIPKNFSSRVRVLRPETNEDREVTIRMNEPLRYGGKTFFQASWDEATEKATILQVVDNPGWLTPYLACVIVAVGMLWQFSAHLFGFARKTKPTAKTA